jgi:hypothetical protein
MSKSIIIEILDYSNSVLGRLDISDSQDFPLALSYTISDGKDLESRFGDFSKSFDIPSTKNNNKLLGHIYNPLIKDTKNISGIKDCRILVEGIPFFVGQIQIKGSKQTTKPTSYQATIYGGNFAWASLLRDKNLCDLTFASSQNLTYDYTDIANSWASTQASSDVVYPLVSYGDFYPTGIAGAVNMFDSSEFSQDWRGWIWVYNMIKEIFSNIGYNVSSDFMETADFKKLISHFNWFRSAEDEQTLQDSYKAEITRTGSSRVVVANYITLGQTSLNNAVKHNNEVADPSNAYSTSTGVWTCKRAGYYKIKSSINITIGQSPISPFLSWYCQILLKLKKTSGSTTSTLAVTEVEGSQTTHSLVVCPTGYKFYQGAQVQTNGYVYFEVNDTVETTLDFSTQSAGNATTCYCDYSSNTGTIAFPNHIPEFLAEYEPKSLAIGETFSLNSLLPCDVSQIEFLKGISHLFNLYFSTDVQSKTVYIEPFNEFFTYENSLDWTSKLDYSKPIQDNYSVGLKEQIIFRYKEDSNDKWLESINEFDNDNVNDNPKYSYYESLGQDYNKGKKEFVNPVFAPTQQEFDNDTARGSYGWTNGVLIPVMWEDVVPSVTVGTNAAVSPFYRPDKGDNYEPRILYYHGNVVNPNTLNYFTNWSKQTATSITSAHSDYPRATFVDWEDTSFPSLSYDDESVTLPNTSTAVNVKGLYSTYWKNMIEQLKSSPKVRTVHLNLKIKDIINLDMRRLIFLDGSWWRINKIIDFSPAKNTTTKVELIQWLQV